MASQDPSLAEQESFDVIIHDLVEAGEIPARAFSMEFWEQLRTLLRERGVIAVVRSSLAHYFPAVADNQVEICGAPKRRVSQISLEHVK